MSISANLRLLRKKAKFTQIELAEKAGVSIATLRRWEAGETTPNGTRIIEIANILGVSPDEIVGGEETHEPLSSGGGSVIAANERPKGMLIFEGEGVRVELPPTEKGYELFTKLVDNFISSKKA